MPKSLIVLGWLVSCIVMLSVSTTTLQFLLKPQYLPEKNSNSQAVTLPNTSQVESPATLGIATSAMVADARAEIIARYLHKYDSPMSGYASLIVETANLVANEYNLDATQLAYLTIAIAQNESNLGKRMPENCFNAWGWGIHSAGTLCFDSWEEAIPKYMNDFAKEYMHKQGLNSPEAIMSRYTPHSPNGAWAKNVSHFLHLIETYTFE